MNNMQDIQQLALVFMDAFNLHIEQGIDIQMQIRFVQGFFIVYQALFCRLFDSTPAMPEVGIVSVGFQFF